MYSFSHLFKYLLLTVYLDGLVQTKQQVIKMILIFKKHFIYVAKLQRASRKEIKNISEIQHELYNSE